MSLTPVRVEILRFLAELRFLSLPQIAKLCCPSGRKDLSEKSARRHMRALFDAGLVDVLPVSRAALAPPGTPNDASLLYGSAPNVYAVAARGLEVLQRMGLLDRQDAGRKKPAYGPKNSLFLAHERLAGANRKGWRARAGAMGGRRGSSNQS
jgi:DNA-binding transcriptional ArsR family regulator